MQHRVFPTTLCAALLFAMSQSVLFGLGTPAGTVIPAACRMAYFAGSRSLAAAASVSATVAQTGGAALLMGAAPQSVYPGQSHYIPLTTVNTGNGADTIVLSASSTQGWGITFVRDDNKDGVHQAAETTAIASTGRLAPDTSIGCFLKLAVPSSAASSNTIAVTGSSVFASSVASKAVLAIQLTKPHAVPGDFNSDKVVSASDISRFNRQWYRWHRYALPTFAPAVDSVYDLAPRTTGAWPTWDPVGDRKIDIQDATAFVECCMGSQNPDLAYNTDAQAYWTQTLILVTVTSAPYGVYQASINVGNSNFRPVTDANGNLARVVRGSRAGTLLYSEYDAATRTIRITGNVTGDPPYRVATIYIRY